MVENFFIAHNDRVRELGGWDARLKVSEHAEFFIRAKQLGLKVGYTPRASVDHVHIQRERASADYAPFRGYRQAEFRRIWLAKHGIQRFVERDGTSISAEDWIRREEWPRPSRRAAPEPG
jgi:hypothetical protein